MQETILTLIRMERGIQNNKWGVQDHSNERWLTILAEEFGEVAKALLESDDGLANELLQTAAVCVAWLESLERQHGTRS